MTEQRIKDPNKIAVQINIKVPFDFREFLYTVAESKNTTLTTMLRDMLYQQYGSAFTRREAPAPR